MAAELKAKISLNTSAFTKGISIVKGQITALSSVVSSSTAAIGAAFAGVLSVGVFAKGIKGALDFGSTLQELSARTGAPIKDLVILQKAFKDAGVGAEAVGPAINRLQKAITGVNEDGEPTNKTFEMLKVNLDEIKKLSPQDQFQAIGKAIAALGSESERTTAAMGLFGKGGGEMLAIFKDPAAMENAAQSVGKQAQILQDNAKKFDDISDRLNSVSDKVRGFFVGVAQGMLPALEKVANILSGLKLEEAGKKFGQSLQSGINILMNAFKEGKLGELAGLSLKIAFGEAVNFLAGAMISLGQAQIKMIGRLFSQDFFEGIALGFKGVTLLFSGFLLEAFQTPLAFLSAGFERISTSLANWIGEKLNPLFKKLGLEFQTIEQGTFQDQVGSHKKNFSTLGVGLGGQAQDAFSQMSDKISPVVNDIVKLIATEFSNFKPSELINTQQWKDALEKLAKDLNKPLKDIEEAAQMAIGGGTSLSMPTAKGKPLDIDQDRFTRLGLFVGGSGGNAAIGFARKTADNTSKMVKSLMELAKQKTVQPMGAIWAD